MLNLIRVKQTLTPDLSDQNSEFSRLLEKPRGQEPFVITRKLPTIARSGINILSPKGKIADYLGLICREMQLKQDYLSPKQPVCSLRMKGYPLRQFNEEELTELIFKLCTRYRVLDGDQGERRISMTPEQCASDQLALLKGLGFNNARIHVDASIAGPDRSLDPVKRAIATIYNFSGYTISAEVIFGADTSPDYLEKLVGFLAQSDLDEIEFYRDSATPGLSSDHIICHQTFKFIADVMASSGYRLIGDKSFKKVDHPDFALLRTGKLGYGPWGFYNLATTEWLGLGAGADGMIAGYLYHNAAGDEDYIARVSNGQSPVKAWSPRPMAEEQSFDFIQQLYCQHKVERRFFLQRLPLLKSLKVMGWLAEKDDLCKLTQEGILNLPTICNLYSRRGSLDEG